MTADAARGVRDRVCVVLGEQTLLTQCCDILLGRGYEIACVVSDNPLVRQWCADRSIRVEGYPESLSALLGPESFDWLFSITNLRILPPDVLAMPARLAINFHDGPLPEYGGLNAPVWALLDGVERHGVSWHVMTEVVDDGDLLAQETFAVAPDETAFSLNAKCYQAAIGSFPGLLANLEGERHRADRAPGVRDELPRSVRPTRQRRDHRLVEAGGAHRAARACARLRSRSKPRHPAAAEPREARTCWSGSAKPDSIRRRALPARFSTRARTGCACPPPTARSRSRECRRSTAREISLPEILAFAALRVGDRLSVTDPEIESALTRTVMEAARYEPFWVRQLSSTDPLEVIPTCTRLPLLTTDSR